MASNLGSMVVSLGLDAAQFVQGLTKAEYQAQKSMAAIVSSARTLQNTIRGIGATLGIGIGVGAFVNMIKGTIDAQDHLENLSKSAGISVEQLGGLGFAAKQTGGNVDDMAAAFKKFSVNIAEAASGNQKQLENFDALGISLQDLQTLSPDQIFIKAATAFASFGEDANKAARASLAFGKTYQGILPTLDQGGAKLQQQIDYFQRFGGVTAEVTKQASEFDAEMVKAQLLSGAFSRTLTADLLPSMKVMIEYFIDAKEKGEGFSAVSQGIVEILKLLAGAALTGAFAMKTFGEAFATVAAGAAALAHGDLKAFEAIGNDFEARLVRRSKELSDTLAALRDASNANQTAVPWFKRTTTRNARPLVSDDSQDASKKILERDLAALDAFIKAEEDLLKQRESFLQGYFQNTQIDLTQYYATRQSIIGDALQNQIEAFRKEEALLNARIKVAKPTERAEDEKKLADVIARRAKVEQDAAVASIRLSIEQTQEVEKFRDKVEELAIALAELQGSPNAAASRFDFQNRALQKQLDLEKQSADASIRRNAEIGDSALAASRKIVIALDAQNTVQRKYSETLESLSIKQGQIDLLAQSGAITEIDAINRRAEAAQGYIAKLQLQIDAQSRLTEELRLFGSEGLDAAVNKLERMKLEMAQVAAASDVLANKFREVFVGSVASAITDLATGAKSLKDVFKDLVKSIDQGISQIASKQIAETLFAKGGAGGGIPDFFAKLFGGGAKTVAGAAGGAGAAVGTAGADAALATLGATAGTVDISLTTLDASTLVLDGSLTVLDASIATVDGSFLTLDGTAVTVEASFTAAAFAADALALALEEAALSNAASSAGQAVAFLASGTDYWRGGQAIVGEHGPELVNLPRGAQVIPNEVFQARRQTNSTVFNTSINVLPGASTASSSQAAKQFAQEQRRLAARRG